ncbi:pentapeptide repeat-containing protein [Actinoplanes sp. DH11]|uniref:pentapeptide repeat-containing protein n=1 Tax=Actinoplanes sp. DH11 TaxID=2857011 RepID=UPI0035B01AEF
MSYRLLLLLRCGSRALVSSTFLSGALFSSTLLGGAFLSGTLFSGTLFSGALFSSTLLGSAFLGGTGAGRDLGVGQREAGLEQAALGGNNGGRSGARVSSALLAGAFLSRTAFSGALLGGTLFSRTAFSGALLGGTLLLGRLLQNLGPLLGLSLVLRLLRLLGRGTPGSRAVTGAFLGSTLFGALFGAFFSTLVRGTTVRGCHIRRELVAGGLQRDRRGGRRVLRRLLLDRGQLLAVTDH